MTVKQFFESEEKLAIHCDTEDKAKVLLKAFDNNGYTWSGYKYTGKTRWHTYKEETCYTNVSYFYDNRECLQRNRYRIIEFEDIEI